MLWFAFKLVSLNHWIQHKGIDCIPMEVVICFQISIFEPLNTAFQRWRASPRRLWFAFKLVSLNHWIQQDFKKEHKVSVVICFQISIFEPLNTAVTIFYMCLQALWFAFKLVSLNHWIQPWDKDSVRLPVVICFQISIFEPLNTADLWIWFCKDCCDLLSN